MSDHVTLGRPDHKNLKPPQSVVSSALPPVMLGTFAPLCTFLSQKCSLFSSFTSSEATSPLSLITSSPSMPRSSLERSGQLNKTPVTSMLAAFATAHSNRTSNNVLDSLPFSFSLPSPCFGLSGFTHNLSCILKARGSIDSHPAHSSINKYSSKPNSTSSS